MKTLFFIIQTGMVMARFALTDTQPDWKVNGFVFITTGVLFTQKIDFY